MAAKAAQNAPGVTKSGTMAALRRSSPELAKVCPGSRVSPKSQGYGEAPEFRQNRAGRGALEGAVEGVGLHGWPFSGTRARRYAPQTPGTRVSLHGFGGSHCEAQQERGAATERHSKGRFRRSRRTSAWFQGGSPKPCRTRGAGGRCRGGWAARVADFGDPCKAICPTGLWNEGQLARFWRPATREPTRDAGAALAAPRRVSRVPGGIWPAKKNGCTPKGVHPIALSRRNGMQDVVPGNPAGASVTSSPWQPSSCSGRT